MGKIFTPSKTFDLLFLDHDYHLSFNNSTMSFDICKQLSKDADVTRIEEAYSLTWDNKRLTFHIRFSLGTHNILDLNVKLPTVNISKTEILEKIEKVAPYLENPKIEDLFILNKDSLLVKGTYIHKTLDHVFEHPYFGIFFANKDKPFIEDNHALLRVLSIDGKYYFVTHFMKPESGGAGLVIFRLDEKVLTEIFTYYNGT